MIDGNEILREYKKALEQIRYTDDEEIASLCAIAAAMPFLLGILLDIRDATMEVNETLESIGRAIK